MKRRHFVASIMAGGMLAALAPGLAVGRDVRRFHDLSIPDKVLGPLERAPEWWRQRISGEAWHILFEEGTERAFSSPLDKEYSNGTYVCAACHLPLFTSDTKYDSGTGWPSFWAVEERHIDTKTDYRGFWPRTEYHCVRCGGHQGHVFDDGPEPTGKRWCNNGLALIFVSESGALPALRG